MSTQYIVLADTTRKIGKHKRNTSVELTLALPYEKAQAKLKRLKLMLNPYKNFRIAEVSGT